MAANPEEANPQARRVRQWVWSCACGGTTQTTRSCQSLALADDALDRPDLSIYSQAQVIADGGLPSWDSPDIATTTIGPMRLLPEAAVTIHNLSPTSPAVNALVHLYTAEFGIGLRRTLRASRRVSVPAGGNPTLMFPFDQEIIQSGPPIAIFVQIEHSADNQLANNVGEQVADGVFTSEVGRSFARNIPVRNNSNFERRIDLRIIPTDLSVTIVPESHIFQPDDGIVALLQVDVPPSTAGTPSAPESRNITVVATSEGALIGGATRLLIIDT